MWPWILVGYAMFIAVLVGAAVFVALFGSDENRRSAGYKVLKLIWFGVPGPGGVVACILKFHEIGLL
jgi:hypothetical protein